uniref:WD repeat domain 73 n=1 Tax=Gallus gallus TaxID=9031 RepID=A0A8V0X9Z0_CHICK
MEAAGERGEEEEEEEEEEEWLLQSLHLYEALHAFELQAPTRVIEWALGKRVCVAGYGCAGRNEILQLLPPAALEAKESRGLCPERDFKVECGGFSNRPVYNLKHVPDTSLLVTSGPPDSSLQLWQMSAEDSDVIKSVSAISTENSTGEGWAKIATISMRAPWVLHGSRLSSTQITEVESRKKVYVAGFSLRSVPCESSADGFGAKSGAAAHVVPNPREPPAAARSSSAAWPSWMPTPLCCAAQQGSCAWLISGSTAPCRLRPSPRRSVGSAGAWQLGAELCAPSSAPSPSRASQARGSSS